jgi:flagellar hook-length control protein FliK
MTNLPITINHSQPPARGADSQLSRSGSPAASTNAAAGAARKNDGANDQPADPFGAVLARQMQAEEASASASNTPHAPGTDTKTMADSAAQTGAESDKASVNVGTPNDTPGVLIAMLQLPQEIKSTAVKDAMADAATTATRGITGTTAWMADIMAASRGASGVAMLHKTGADASQAATGTGAIQTRAKFGMATAASDKADAAAMVADSLTATDKTALHNISDMGITVPSELPESLPLDTARSAQGIAQSVASLMASGIQPNMLANNKTANSLQTISSPLGSKGWSEEFSQKITWMGTQQNQVAELHLNPPNLGPLDVVLKISDNQATALFTSPHSAVRDAVENALPRLREILADNGITLGNTMVSDQSPRDRGADGFAGQGSAAMARRETVDEVLKAAELASATTQAIPIRRHNGMVDTFV